MTVRAVALTVSLTLATGSAVFVAVGCSGGGSAPASNANTARPVPAVAPGPSDPDAPQEVSFTTEDGVMIAGDLYLPETTPAPAVLALHQWDSDRAAYRDFARSLREAGFVVLAIDGRGFGGSKQGADGAVAPSRDIRNDVDAAVDYLEAQPAVDALRIGVMGASYGASNALIYAAEHPDKVRSAALLSVGLAYDPSIPTEPAMKKYGDRPLLLVAARDDAASAGDTETLGAGKGARHRVKVYDAGGHGTALLAPAVGGSELVKDFFVETLTGPIVTREGAEGDPDAEGGGAVPQGESAPANENSKGSSQ
jgi:dienelactone hydrolase